MIHVRSPAARNLVDGHLADGEATAALRLRVILTRRPRPAAYSPHVRCTVSMGYGCVGVISRTGACALLTITMQDMSRDIFDTHSPGSGRTSPCSVWCATPPVRALRRPRDIVHYVVFQPLWC